MQGFINVYKMPGCTSAKVVSTIKKKYNLSKVGHMGTLDPMAEGVLPIAVGKATRMFDYFLNKTKTYRVKMQFGMLTDTLDITGKVIDQSNVMPTLDNIINVLPKFIGKISQLPPEYSAKNVNGVRAYTLARLGKSVELKPCDVEIKDLQIVEYSNGVLTLDCECGSGTYIRSLVRDIAQALDTYATMIYLCRTSSGYFNVDNSVDVEKYSGDLSDILLSIDSVFDYMSKLKLTHNQAMKISNGLTLSISKTNGNYLLYDESLLIGVGNIDSGILKLKTYLKEN